MNGVAITASTPIEGAVRASAMGISIAAGTPTYGSETNSAVDGTGTNYNASTISLTVSGANPLLIASWHSEFDGGTPYYWTVTYNGVEGRLFIPTDGYAGGAGNKRFRTYYWVGPAAGAHDLVVALRVGDKNSAPYAGANELAVSAVLLNGAAQTFYPFRDVQKDISAATRTGESVTVNSTTTDLVVHIIASSLTARGTLGAGETSRSIANNGTDISSLWVSTKAGAASTTTVSSTGWANTFALEGVAFSVMAAGTAETYTLFTDTYARSNEAPLSNGGTWTTPVGNITITAVNLASNKAIGSTAAENLAMVNSPSFPANQRSQMIYNGAIYAGPGVRLTSAVTANGYVLSTSMASVLQLLKITDNGATEGYAAMGADILPARALVAGDLLELEVSGSATTTLNVYWNQMLIATRTDSSSPFTSGQPFIRSFGNTAFDAGFQATSLPVRLP